MALEDKTPPEDVDLNPSLVDAIKNRQVDGVLSCAGAFTIAGTIETEPVVVGQAADVLGVRLSRCQLGLFGYPGKQGWKQADIDEYPVPEGLTSAVKSAVDASGDLACTKAWQVAEQFNVPRMVVGSIADQLGIHIVQCQLGAF